jgi:glycosyltransferase involved in cell wall biosynthesis
MNPTSIDRTTVLHIGVAGADVPGGMAQVLEEYKSWSFVQCDVQIVASTRGKGEPISFSLWLGAARRLVRAALRRHPLVVVVHMSQRGSFIREGSLAWLSHLLRVATAVHIHGSGFVPFASRFPRIARWGLAPAHTIFALTDETQEAVRAIKGSKAISLVAINNAVGEPLECPPAKQQIVIFGGEVGRRKGVHVLLEAWRKVNAQSPEWKLLIAGAEANDFVIERTRGVEFLGAVSRNKLQQLESVASIAVLPSFNEAMPIFLIESMARKCSIVSTDVGQIPDLVGDAGIIVPPGDVDALSDALIRLITNPPKMRQLGDKGYNRYRNRFSADAVAAELESEWLNLARRRNERV